MDFMNLNQSAHGDREFGHITSRLRMPRKVVVVTGRRRHKENRFLDAGMRRMGGCARMLVIRFGDNMNNVAVTDGDKVEAEIRLGYHVDNAHATLVPYVEAVTKEEIDALIERVRSIVRFRRRLQAGTREALVCSRRRAQEIGLRRFLQES